MTNTNIRATFIGQIGLFIWAATAACAYFLRAIPSCQILFTVFGLSFIFSVCYIAFKRKWYLIKEHSALMWGTGIICICGSEMFYVMSFRYAPPEHVDMINYLWPLMMIASSFFMPNERIAKKDILGCFLGLYGVYIVLMSDNGSGTFASQYYFGYCLAFLAAVLWATYNIVARYQSGEAPPEIMGIYCGVGAFVALIGHQLYGESFIIPSTSEWLIMSVMGLTTYGIAYFCWNLGVSKGNFHLLTVLSYANPFISVGILIFFGAAKLTLQLFFGSLFVVVAGFISGEMYKIIPTYIVTRFFNRGK